MSRPSISSSSAFARWPCNFLSSSVARRSPYTPSCSLASLTVSRAPRGHPRHLATPRLRLLSTQLIQRSSQVLENCSKSSDDSVSESNRHLLELDEREESELRDILRERFRLSTSNWQEPVSVWRNEETGEIEWIDAEQTSENEDSPEDSNPWFVEELEPELPRTSDIPSHLESSPPAPAPARLPPDFQPLYRYLIDSPFVDRSSVSFIDAKAEPHGHGDAAWTDWVVVVQMKEGREGGIRGATEAVREILSAATDAQVRVEGISGDPSARWTMVDGGKIVVHILTKESRELYKIEDIWTGKRDPLELRNSFD